jgi:hypothetical protein
VWIPAFLPSALSSQVFLDSPAFSLLSGLLKPNQLSSLLYFCNLIHAVYYWRWKFYNIKVGHLPGTSYPPEYLWFNLIYIWIYSNLYKHQRWNEFCIRQKLKNLRTLLQKRRIIISVTRYVCKIAINRITFTRNLSTLIEHVLVFNNYEGRTRYFYLEEQRKGSLKLNQDSRTRE